MTEERRQPLSERTQTQTIRNERRFPLSEIFHFVELFLLMSTKI